MEKKINNLIQKGSGEISFLELESICKEFENHFIEFKSFRDFETNSLEKIKKDFSKYVSAFSNTSGGIITFGVDDKTHKIESEGISENHVSGGVSEWLSRITASTTEPSIQDFCVMRIPHPNNEDQNYYLISIGRSEKAPHQANDFRYYGRYDKQVLPLHDQQIRDIMNRTKKAKVFLEIEFRGAMAQTHSALRVWPSITILNDVVIEKGCFIVSTFAKSGATLKTAAPIPGVIEYPRSGKRYTYHDIIYPGDKFDTKAATITLQKTKFKALDSLEVMFTAFNCESKKMKYKLKTDVHSYVFGYHEGGEEVFSFYREKDDNHFIDIIN